MAYPLAGTPWSGSHPNPPYAGNYIPEIWSLRMLQKYYAATVLREIANTDYEGEIRRMGDTVHIRTIPNITIRNYSIEQSLVVDRFSSPKTTLLIDKGKYVNMPINDVYAAQTDINLFEMLTTAASNEMRIEIDRDVLGGIYGSIVPANVGNAAGAITGKIRLGAPGAPLVVKTNPSAANEVDPTRLVMRMANVLDEQNIPSENRWIVAPPWFAQLCKLSDLKDASLTGDRRSPLRTGAVGLINNTPLYLSNLLPTAVEGTTVVHYIFMGHRDAITFATQIVKSETLPNQSDFGVLVRMLQIYGYKVLHGTGVTAAYAYGDF